MAIQRIVVDLGVIDKQIQSFMGKLDTLKQVMAAIDGFIKVLSAVSWISPASKLLLAKYQLLLKQIQEAIRIVDEYIHDLMVVRTQYGNVEKALEDKMSALRTDVFGV